MVKKAEKKPAKAVKAPAKPAPKAVKTVKAPAKPAKAAKAPAKKAPAKPAPKAAKAPAKKAPAKPAPKAVKTAKAPAKKAPAKPAPKAAKAPAKKAPAKPAPKAVKTAKAPAKPAPKAVKTAKAPAKPAAKPAPAAKAPVKPAAPAVAKASVKKTITRVRKDEILKKLRLSKADKKYFRELLLRARAAFGDQVRYHSDDALTRKDAPGERAGMATHMADLGTDNYRRDFQLGLLSDGVDVLEMIDEALQRLEDSEYGICLDCGEPIPRKRLEAKPYAKYCTKCKSKREEQDETFYHRR
ncbi:MAG: TraR/DksA C4-type zinc finger protein [Lentisphaeria bacterium]|nr:TraR/DksA C4-type zinc finger protein [Lentisphaeria bacterium]